jgi:UTP--glucose-1-phosphate uridylyltransferase
MSDAPGLSAALEKLRADGAGPATVTAFEHYARRLAAGDAGVLREHEIEPVTELPDADELPDPGAGAAPLLDATVVIKLNGGLGTSMGMTQAKSLLPVKDGLSFLDVIARQLLHQRAAAGASAPRLPLVLMNSFATREASLAALARYPELAADLPPDVVQSRVPKLLDDGSLAPASGARDPDLEWAPPGHGDLYTALAASRLLDAMLERGYRYAFVSNADNLGAVLDPAILAWFAAQGAPFLMEVADRTAADRKGGHLARRAGGGLVLREIAQTAEPDVESFQDTSRHRYFNTNSVWLDLRALAEVMAGRGFIALPMIVNRKTLDPADASSPAVIQLETAMGAAIDAFDGALALRVPRTRFLPVKTTDDLLVLRSDAFLLDEQARVVLAPQRAGRAPLARLDPAYYKLIGDFDARFPAGPPSLVGCERLTVIGDVRFGAGVVVRGEVTVEHAGGGQLVLADGSTLGA